MRAFVSLVELIETALANDGNEWIYTNLAAWNDGPERATFWLISDAEVDAMDDSEVYASDDGPLLPLSLRAADLRPWMLLDSIRGVLLNLRMDKATGIDTDLVIHGINYYREHDDYLDA